MKKKILALALVGAALLSGCASVPKDAGQNPDDPWESLNRQTFAFNQGLDFILIRPLAKGYQFITPKPVREGVTRVFQNTMEPSNAVNNVLQGKVEEGILSLFRLMINSTVGVVGIFDVAQMVDIPRMPEDFGRLWRHGASPRALLRHSRLRAFDRSRYRRLSSGDLPRSEHLRG